MFQEAAVRQTDKIKNNKKEIAKILLRENCIIIESRELYNFPVETT